MLLSLEVQYFYIRANKVLYALWVTCKILYSSFSNTIKSSDIIMRELSHKLVIPAVQIMLLSHQMALAQLAVIWSFDHMDQEEIKIQMSGSAIWIYD